MVRLSVVINNHTQFLIEGIDILIYQKFINGNCGLTLGQIVFICNLPILRCIRNLWKYLIFHVTISTCHTGEINVEVVTNSAFI